MTVGQLIVRLSQYCGGPSRVVVLPRRFNPDGYQDGAMHCLHSDATSLDMGFSYPLQRDAWSCCSAAPQTDAGLYLLTGAIQEKIGPRVARMEASTTCPAHH